MKIGIQTWGSDGDILPFLALAIGLRRAGHDVTLVYTSVDNKDYSSFATDYDIGLVRAHERFDEDGAAMFADTVKTGDPLKELALVMASYFVPALDEMYAAAQQLCQDNDLVIGHGIHYPLAIAAEKARRPRVAVALCPMIIETKSISPFDTDLGRWLNSLLWKLGDRLVRKRVYGPADELRQREGLRPLTYLQNQLYVTRELTLVATSSVLCPRPADWGNNIQICGFLNPPRPAGDWQMPEELSTFLDSGEPPVYFTFGSCTQFDPENTTRLFLDAATKARVRAIVQSNWEALPTLRSSPHVYRVTTIPHEHVFPHCSLIVHHGGSGTTQSSLKAGKPSVVVAHAYDQPYWGRKLMQVGAAGKVLQRRKTTSDILAHGIRDALGAPRMAQSAKRAGEVMAGEDGVKNAVALIERTFR